MAVGSVPTRNRIATSAHIITTEVSDANAEDACGVADKPVISCSVALPRYIAGTR